MQAVLEDEEILNMMKPLTVSALNRMFQEKQDIFESLQERDDWKYPKYVTIEKSSRHNSIELYNLKAIGNQQDGFEDEDAL